VSYEDDDDPVGGSLPDPSVRHWRHPSELGQLAGASPAPSPERLHLSHSLMAIGVVALGGVAATALALTVGGSSMFGQRGLTIADTDMVGVPQSTPIETTIGDPAEDSIESESEATTESSAELALPPSDADEGSDELQSYVQPVPEIAHHIEMNGIFAGRHSGRRLSSFTVFDGMVITSANAIGGRTNVWIRTSGTWLPARVAGIDPYSDVAVLEPENWGSELQLSEVEVAVDALGVSMNGLAVELAKSGAEDGDGDGVNVELQPTGIVISDEGSVMGSTGFEIYDVIVTSLPSTPHELGAAVHTEDGAVGMVIDTKTPVLAAIPLDAAAEIATSLMYHGMASEAWLGVEAVTGPDSEVRLTSVDSNGPSAGLLAEDDVIVSVEGEQLHNADHLVHMVREAGADAELDVVVRRGRRLTSIDVRTTRAPAG